MKPNISEFSYGYAVTDELVHGTAGVTAAPVFPSLIEEGRAGGGYDLMLSRSTGPLFVQFKLSDCMKRRSVAEVRDKHLDTPFYRMHLRPGRHSRQHQMLLDLEKSGQQVFYVAPGFHELEEFDDAFRDRKVLAQSMWINPLSIGELDDDDHHVSFVLGGKVLRCSQPVQMRGSFDSESALSRVFQSSLTQDARQAVFQALAVLSRPLNTQLPLLPEVWKTRIQEVERSHPLEQLAFHARRTVDAQLFMIQRDGQ